MRLVLLLLALAGAVHAGWLDHFGEKVVFTLFLPHRNVTQGIRTAAEVVRDPSFDRNRVTVLYMHGYTESNTSESVAFVAQDFDDLLLSAAAPNEAFLKRGDHNFIFIDWNDYAKSPYLRAFFNLYQVSHAIADAIKNMVNAGMPKDKLWMVAHSMGGQLAGVVSKDLDFKVPRITALDPALPGFTLDGIPSLGREDAHFVDVIHTDAGFLGVNAEDGHLNFWPNGGSRVQPGCPFYSMQIFDGHCSHHRSWRFFAESLLNETAFQAFPCSSWKDMEDGKCDPGKQSKAAVYMGIKAGEARGKKGNFYLHTNRESPYGRGAEGLRAEPAGALRTIGNALKKIPSIRGDPLVTDFGWT